MLLLHPISPDLGFKFFLAVSSEDYDSASITLPNFDGSGVTERCVNISALADMILEATQSFNITLTSSNANVDSPSTMTVDITDANSMFSV